MNDVHEARQARRLAARALATLALVTLPGLLGCSGDDAVQDCASTGVTKSAVVTFATFARLLEEGGEVAEGLDLDDHDTREGEEAGCYKQDFVSPDGEAGIDNQFATLLPLIEGFVGTENIDAIVSAAILNGQLLILLTVEGVDDPVNDSCVNVVLGAGQGKPNLTTSGEYESYQTFAYDTTDTPISRLANGRIDNGVLTAGPGRLMLPVRALDANFNLDLSFAKVRVKLHEDPLYGGLSMEGVAAGGLLAEDFKAIVSSLNIGGDVIGAVVPLVGSTADLGMDADGSCHHVSAGLKMRATPAFVLPESAASPDDEG